LLSRSYWELQVQETGVEEIPQRLTDNRNDDRHGKVMNHQATITIMERVENEAKDTSEANQAAR